MPEKPRDAVTVLADELAGKFGTRAKHDADVVVAPASEHASAKPQPRLGGDAEGGSDYTAREHILKRQQVATFDVWVSALVCKTIKYNEVQAAIESSPFAIIVRTPFYVITGEGRGMHSLRTNMARETVPELTLAKDGAVEEWSLTALHMYYSADVEATLREEDGKLVVAKIPPRQAGSGSREPAND